MAEQHKFPYFMVLLAGVIASIGLGSVECRAAPKQVVICPFQSHHIESPQASAAVLSDLLAIDIANSTDLTAVDYSAIDASIREAMLTGGGMRHAGDAMMIGRLVKADLVVTGQLYTKLNSDHIAIKVIHPKSGILIGATSINVNSSDLAVTVTAMRQFISRTAQKSNQGQKSRQVAFCQVEVGGHNRAADFAAELKLRLQAHYLSHPDLGVVVRSQFDTLLVERFLQSMESMDQTSQANVLAATPSAVSLVDIFLQANGDDGTTQVMVKADNVGLAPHIVQFRIDSTRHIVEPLITNLNSIFSVRSKACSPARKMVAEKLYQRAMQRAHLSYQHERIGQRRRGKRPPEDKVRQEIRESIDLFEEALSYCPDHHQAMVALAWCYLHKLIGEEKRANDLLRTVHISTDQPTLKRIAKSKLQDGKISRSIFEEITDDPDLLMADLIEKKYIDTGGHILDTFSTLQTPEQLKLRRPFKRIQAPVFYLLQETAHPPYRRYKYGSTSPEAIMHFKRGLNIGNLRFRPINRSGVNRDIVAMFLSWQYAFPPEVVAGASTRSKIAVDRLRSLRTAADKFATALFLDPKFHEAMVMLSACLEDPLVDQKQRADSLLETVWAETSDEYLKYYAAVKLSRLHATKFSERLSGFIPGRNSPRPAQKRTPRVISSGEGALSTPLQAVTMTGLVMEQKPSVPEQQDMSSSKPSPSADELNSHGRPNASRRPMTPVIGNLPGPDLQPIETALVFEMAGRIENNKPVEISAVKYVSKDRYCRTRGFGKSVGLSDGLALIGSPWARMQYPPTGNREDGGGVYLLKEVDHRWQHVTPLIGDPPAWNTKDRFGMAVGLCPQYAIIGAPFDKETGPLQMQDLRDIAFESNVDSQQLMDQLFRLKYVDVNRFVTADVRELKTKLHKDFPECTSKDLDAIQRRLKASLGRDDSGSATLFDLHDTTLGNRITLRAMDAVEANEFGRCVSVSAQHALVGSKSGAYFFQRTGSQWRQTVKFPLGRVESCDLFENHAILGTIAYSRKGGKGSVRIGHFKNGHWYIQSEIDAPQFAKDYDSRQSAFGHAVAIDGPYAVIGNPLENFGQRAMARTGSVLVYRRHHELWRHYATLTAGPNSAPVGGFGTSVAVNGSYLIVGEPGAKVNGNRNAGAVHIYKISETSIDYLGRITLRNSKRSNELGEVVAVADGYVLIGAHRDGGTGRNRGAAYAFKIPSVSIESFYRSEHSKQAGIALAIHTNF